MAWLATDRLVTVTVAWPVPSRDGVPIVVPSDLNVTVPVGVGAPWVRVGLLVLVAYGRLPRYEAVTEWLPVDSGLARVDELRVAVALPPGRATSVVLPSMVKRTVPVGVPAPGAVGDTVAVNVTFW